MAARRRKVLLAAGIAVVVAGASGAWAVTRASGSPAPPATLVAATTGTFSQTVAASGTLEPAQRADLSFRVAGTVTSVPVVVGQRVGKGAVLATVDSSALRTQVDAAAATVSAASQQLTADAAGTAAQQAADSAALSSAQAALATARQNLAATVLSAPFDGVIAAVTMTVGDPVGSSAAASGGSSAGSAATGGGSASSSGAETITEIRTDSWLVNATVGSADLPSLRPGLEAQVTPTGSRSTVFGTVASVGILASTSSGGTAAFPVVIDVTGNPPGLYAGSTADVSIVVRQVSGVLAVPTVALHTLNGAVVVYRDVHGKRQVTPVTVGAVYGAMTAITHGLAAGDQVEVALTRFGGGVRRTGGAPGRGGGFGGGGFGGGFGGGGG